MQEATCCARFGALSPHEADALARDTVAEGGAVRPEIEVGPTAVENPTDPCRTQSGPSEMCAITYVESRRVF